MSGYASFAGFYDALTANVDYPARAGYFWSLFERFGCKPGLLLDLACGTGSLSLAFAGLGAEVIAVDASADMLSIAQGKAAEKGEEILFLRQPMQKLDLYGTVDAAVCALDSINHLIRPEDVRETFRRVGLFLNPGGLFAFDVNTLKKHRETLANNVFVYDTPAVYCVWQNHYQKESGRVRIDLDFFEKQGALYRRSGESFSERAYSQAELAAWLEEAGFALLARYGEDSFAPPAEDADRVIYIARKRD